MSILLIAFLFAYAVLVYMSTAGLALVFQLAVAVITSSTVALSVAPYISRNFREIREDIPWFAWE
ncbi:MAG: hypothetical protein DRJ67_12270 [Thermoprotei archaeon]|nr:MAG: hypothetical protein DRJ67_12270 [Thermoprotei archaeon]